MAYCWFFIEWKCKNILQWQCISIKPLFYPSYGVSVHHSEKSQKSIDFRDKSSNASKLHTLNALVSESSQFSPKMCLDNVRLRNHP